MECQHKLFAMKFVDITIFTYNAAMFISAIDAHYGVVQYRTVLY